METTLQKAGVSQAELQRKQPQDFWAGPEFNIQEKKILMATLEKEFVNLSEQEQKQTMLSVCAICGCPAPSALDFPLFMTCIKERFSWITREEFMLAFRMNLYGDFAKGEKGKIEHYNVFSTQYLVDVLTAYNKHRGGAIVKSEQMKSAYEVSEEKKQEGIKQWLEDIRGFFKKFKQTGIMPKDSYCRWAFDSLHQRGKITITKEHKYEYYESALVEILEEMSKGADINEARKAKRAIETKQIPSDIQAAAKNRAKKNYLMDTWESMETISI